MSIEGLLAGHLLCDRYRIDAVIGRGGMGVVYRATDVRLDREVAVKVVTVGSGELSTRARLRERFHREARAAARIQHPNVVSVFDFGTDPRLDLDFLVLELLRGEDLAAVLARTARLPVHFAGEVVAQAARGLSAGHEIGFIHRDVKPGNLFLTDGGGGRLRVALLDFGIVQLAEDPADARTATHLTVFGRAPHSPAYAAPEQLRGLPRLSPACDVWSLAVTTFQMLTGEKPFSASDQARLLDGRSVDPPSARRLNPAVPGDLDRILLQALSSDPRLRFRDARAFGAALEDALGPAQGVEFEFVTPSPAREAAEREEYGTLLIDPGAVAPRDSDGTIRWRSPFHPPPPPAQTRRPESGNLEPTLAIQARPEPSGALPTGSTAPTPPQHDVAGVPSRGGWIRRTTRATWSLTITLAACAIAAAFAYGFYGAYAVSHAEHFFASLIGFSIVLPWALYRLFLRRGSFILALGASGLTALSAFFLVAPVAGLDAAVLLLPIGQLAVSVGVLRLTRRQAPRPEPRSALPS